MHPRLATDRDGLPHLLEAVRQHAADLLAQLSEREVVPAAPLPEPEPLPVQGAGLQAALEAFAARWEPALSASAGPRYLGFVTGGVTPAALAGDWMTAAWDQNAFSSLDGAGQHLERETVAWLRALFGLSERQHGTFVSGATMSNTVGLAIAREWLGEQRGVSPAEHGAGALGTVRVLSGAAHSSVPKGLSMLGLGRRALVRVPTRPGREAVDLSALEHALAEGVADGPCIVVANAGTVNTADFDDLRAIAALRERYSFWLHVDAAFGAFAALSPAHAHLVDGLDLADSICIDLHKWLNVPYDSAVQFTRRPDLQTSVFQNAAAYLGPLGNTPDLVHLTPENSRRLRALAAWFTLRAYGQDGHREITERCIGCAHALGDAVESTPGLRLLAPVRLNVVCFTLADNPTTERLAALAEQLADEVFLTPTVLDGVPALRAAFSNWQTTEADTRRTAAALRAALPTRPLHNLTRTGTGTGTGTGKDAAIDEQAHMNDARDTVRQFLLQVRSGLHPDRATHFMADRVRAHQIVSESPAVVERTPQQYTEHVQEMLDAYGPFTLTVDELIAEGDRVYARWTQNGRHVGPVDHHPPTGAQVTAVTSAVYRVEHGRIVEYWIQIDRQGITAQLQQAVRER